MDAFQVLALPRKAALDEEILQRAYDERSREVHPDHGGSDQQAAELNEAFQILRTPDKRLKHLLDLAAPPEATAWRVVPLNEEMMSVFMALGRALEESGRFLERKGKASSALAKALLADEEMLQREVLEALGFQLAALSDRMVVSLMAADRALESPDEQVWKEVAALQARFAYLSKWQTQVRERLLALM